ncbi:MAG: IS1595 family transposase ISTaba1 [Candidatus Doudnabacteria bacterium CG10_big_fil_rev_8_21_14_0_10_42_18]|uniref:IS1595 family transposase ISTaba1 n=1 Tax=Candidatus Doudnabacteria bacterium CG10_big_fil_rev_8_21_14_0_10_42_18 TaxID=1974552 RepID=A0A2H0VB09_9BACT|nr:MAG: IS1595 family transposase ISTaba1 [Candidatus Doudnabacteria bacterium CG10_big_fil_rev_8_21_14_0_10_42_18]
MKYSKLSTFKIKKIISCFSNELTAVQSAKQLELNRNTVDRFFTLFREAIAEYQEDQKIKFRGNVEIDESYFGSRHHGDKRGRSTERKIPVVRLLKRKGQVYTEIIPDASRSSLLPIIQGLIVKSKSNIYTDKWRSYDSLVYQGYKHTRINHSKEFVKGHNHINGIESFWSYVRRKMRKHNGIPKHKFYLYLKESEFRFNNRHQDLTKLLTKLLKKAKIF